MTRPVRHVYLTWSSEPHERVGDARVLNYTTHNEKSRLQLHSGDTLQESLEAKRMCKRLSSVVCHDNERTIAQGYLGLSSGFMFTFPFFLYTSEKTCIAFGHLGHCLD